MSPFSNFERENLKTCHLKRPHLSPFSPHLMLHQWLKLFWIRAKKPFFKLPGTLKHY